MALRRHGRRGITVRVTDFFCWLVLAGTGASVSGMDRARRSLRRLERRAGNQLEASVCSIDARDFGLALSITEVWLQSRVPEDWYDLREVALRRCVDGVHRASARGLRLLSPSGGEAGRACSVRGGLVLRDGRRSASVGGPRHSVVAHAMASAVVERLLPW
jgi:hypothetical protein